jgi:NADH:ubiquinone oxidoreductase subunit F (NADH-binding)
MHELLQKFSKGEATEEDLALLKELADLLRNTSLCGLGQAAPNPFMTALKYFPHEFAARMKPRGDGDATRPGQPEVAR